MNNNEWDERKFIDLLFKFEDLDINESKYMEKEIIAIFKQKDNYHVPYEIITDKIYEESYDYDELIERIRQRLFSLGESIIVANHFDVKKLNSFLIKVNNDISRHIKLSKVQKEYIYKNIKNVNVELEKMQNDITSGNFELKIVRKKLKNANKELKKIQNIKGVEIMLKNMNKVYMALTTYIENK